MLVLSREAGERIMIGADPKTQITIEVLEIRPGRVRIGITAPEHMTIHREEVFRQALERGEITPSTGVTSDPDSTLAPPNPLPPEGEQ